MAASCVATLGVLSGVRSWADEIRVKRDDAAQVAYAKLANYLMNQFDPEGVNRDLAAMRADIVLRASQPVVEKLAHYNDAVNKVKSEGSPVPGIPESRTYKLTPEETSLIRQRTAEMVAAIRSESGFGDMDSDIIEHALFDDVPEAGAPEGARDSESK